MLEHPGLLLCPWRQEPAAPTDTPAKSRPVPTRRVLDLQSHQFLGLVRQNTPQTWPLFRWLARRSWQVLETEDESLLLTVYGPWGLVRPWEIHDAEDRPICSIHASEVYDATGCLRARAAPVPGRINLLSKDKSELASFTPSAHGMELRFSPSIESDPYAKMAVLGAALALER